MLTKNAYFEGEPHCFGQVFRLMAENTKTFSLYDREQPISHLFKEAGILDEWSEAAGYDSSPCAGRQVPTYISFAADVDYASRNIFVENVLKNQGFDVCERSVPVEHLALEHARRSNHLCEDGCYLVLNAYNEHLHFSIYRREGETFVRLAENTLPGMGTDPRVRALVETIVAKINNVQHFLSTPAEKEREYSNLEQHAEGWLRQLDATRGGRPVHLLGVRFSVAPNTFDVNVIAEEINDRTEKIVRAVINEIKNFVAKVLKPDDFLRGILFLGDGFVNEKFSEAVTASYRFQKEDLVYFRRCDLPKIVSVYREINLDQFSTETQKHRKLGEQELIAQRNAQAEAEREREAARLADEKAQVDAAARKDKEEFFTPWPKLKSANGKRSGTACSTGPKMHSNFAPKTRRPKRNSKPPTATSPKTRCAPSNMQAASNRRRTLSSTATGKRRSHTPKQPSMCAPIPKPPRRFTTSRPSKSIRPLASADFSPELTS